MLLSRPNRTSSVCLSEVNKAKDSIESYKKMGSQVEICQVERVFTSGTDSSTESMIRKIPPDPVASYGNYPIENMDGSGLNEQSQKSGTEGTPTEPSDDLDSHGVEMEAKETEDPKLTDSDDCERKSGQGGSTDAGDDNNDDDDDNNDDADDYDSYWDAELERKANDLAIVCNSDACKDAACQEVRGKVEILKKFLNDDEITSDEGDEAWKLLKLVFWHSSRCDEIKCHVPYCEIFVHIRQMNIKSFTDVLPYLKLIHKSCPLLKYVDYLSLDDGINWPSKMLSVPSGRNSPAPRVYEGIAVLWKGKFGSNLLEHKNVCYELYNNPFGNFALPNVTREDVDFVLRYKMPTLGFMAMEAVASTIPSFMLKIKQVPFLSRKNQVEAYKEWAGRLKNGRHENISTLLWMAVLVDSSLLFASHHIVGERGLDPALMKGASNKYLLELTLGLAKGAMFLRQCGLYFLNWTCSAICLDPSSSSPTPRLQDFTCIYPVDDDNADELDMLIHSLDHSCIPNELLDHNIGDFTIVHGMGTLMFHLITGKSWRYGQRHKSLDDKFQSIRDEKLSKQGLEEFIKSEFTRAPWKPIRHVTSLMENMEQHFESVTRWKPLVNLLVGCLDPDPDGRCPLTDLPSILEGLLVQENQR